MCLYAERFRLLLRGQSLACTVFAELQAFHFECKNASVPNDLAVADIFGLQSKTANSN